METRKTNNGLRYREMIYIDGKSIKSPFFNRKTDAREWKSRMLADRNLIRLHGSSKKLYDKVLFSSFSHQWLEEIVKVKNTGRTHINYLSVLRKHLIPCLGYKHLQDIAKSDADKLVSKLSTDGHNGRGINLILGLLKTILREAVRQDYLVKSPLEMYPMIPQELREHSFWSKEDMGKFLQANSSDDHYAFYYAALYTGLRKGELAGLCWDKVDLTNNQLVIARTRDRDGLRETTKSKKVRYIPIHPKLKSLLTDLLKQKLHEKYVFALSDGTPIRVHHTYREFANAQKKASIFPLIRFHDLRHTFASNYVMNGGSVFDLQQILGHSNIQMTMKYAHHSPEHLQSTTKYFAFGEDYTEQVNPILTLMK